MSATKTATIITPATVVSAIVSPLDENIFEPGQLEPEAPTSQRYITLWTEVQSIANAKGNKGHIVPMAKVEEMLTVLAKVSNKAKLAWTNQQAKQSNQYMAKHQAKFEYAAKLAEDLHNELVYVINQHKGKSGVPFSVLETFATHDAGNTAVLGARMSRYDLLKMVQGYRVQYTNNQGEVKNSHRAGMANFRHLTNMMNLYAVQNGYRIGMNGYTLQLTGEQAHRLFGFANMATLQEAPVSQDCVFKQGNTFGFDGYTVVLTNRKGGTPEDNTITGMIVRKPADDEQSEIGEYGTFTLSEGQAFRLIYSNKVFSGLFESVVFGKYGARWNNYALLSDTVVKAGYDAGHIPANAMELEHFWALRIAQVSGGRDSQGVVRFIGKKAEYIAQLFRDHGYFWYQNIDSMEQLLDRAQFDAIYTERMQRETDKRAENRAKREAAKSQEQQAEPQVEDAQWAQLGDLDEHPF